MQKLLIVLAIVLPSVLALPSRNFIINAPITTTPKDPFVLVREKLPEDHLCSTKSACDCSYEQEYEGPYRFTIIDCSNRNLTELPKSLLGLDYPVGELYLHDNKLTEAPDLTKNGYESVFALSLFNNRIRRITENSITPNLQVFFLSGNRISRIDEKVARKFEKLKELRMFAINRNPWICDCKSMSSLKILRQAMRGVMMYTPGTCRRTKIKIDDFNFDELCTNTTTTLSPVRKSDN